MNPEKLIPVYAAEKSTTVIGYVEFESLSATLQAIIDANRCYGYGLFEVAGRLSIITNDGTLYGTRYGAPYLKYEIRVAEQEKIAVWTKKSAALDRIENGYEDQASALDELLKEVLKARAEIWAERIAK